MRSLAFHVIATATTLAIAPPALAAEMLGKWTGTSRAVVAGSGGHYGDGGDVSFRSVDLTIEWTEEDDGRLIGTISSAGHSEPKIAVISSDDQLIVTADADGTSVGRIIDENSFELCYTQSSVADDQMVASCVLFNRAQ